MKTTDVRSGRRSRVDGLGLDGVVAVTSRQHHPCPRLSHTHYVMSISPQPRGAVEIKCRLLQRV